jgi:hypothetical protein
VRARHGAAAPRSATTRAACVPRAACVRRARALLRASLAASRDKGDDASAKRLLGEVLIQMSALTSEDLVLVIAATNRIEGARANTPRHAPLLRARRNDCGWHAR